MAPLYAVTIVPMHESSDDETDAFDGPVVEIKVKRGGEIATKLMPLSPPIHSPDQPSLASLSHTLEDLGHHRREREACLQTPRQKDFFADERSDLLAFLKDLEAEYANSTDTRFKEIH